jgi:hypothetical protein
MLLLNRILLIDVTFSTPTGNYTQNASPPRSMSVMAMLRQLPPGFMFEIVFQGERSAQTAFTQGFRVALTSAELSDYGSITGIEDASWRSIIS